MRRAIAFLLNVSLCLVLLTGLVSLLDDSLVLRSGIHAVTPFSVVLSVSATAILFLVYLLMGLTPLVPKRVFLPLALLFAAITLAVFPVLIYFPHRLRVADWIFSILIVLAGLVAVAQCGFKPPWRSFDEKNLGDRWFSFGNFFGFLAANLFVGVPLVTVYLLLCLGLAIGHYSDGFLRLRPGGLGVQAREYGRADGKSIELVPMVHVGDAGFYSTVSQSFPTNSLILMEGVSDRHGLLTNEISYKRMAKSLGLSEQKEDFAPAHGDMVFADVDVGQFNTNTIGFLNLVMLVHAQGVNARTVSALVHYTPPPGFEDQLLEDLILKRNAHVLEQVRSRLDESDYLVLPWGVAHMPGLARQIQKDGFQLKGTSNYVVIPFFRQEKKP